MTASIAVVDVLSSLLDAMQGSVFRFMGEGSPYLSKANADVRRPLAEMVYAEHRRAHELAEAIESLGGAITLGGANRREDQFLAYLSLKFLLPKLVHEKNLHIERYENTLKVIPKQDGEVRGLLTRHLGEMRQELAALEGASERVIAEYKATASRTATNKASGKN
ncbi:MAG TPA: hypothetical protein VF669_01870 [Tepidisphaeraceae bacterium]